MTCTAILLVFGAINLQLVAAQINVSPTCSRNPSCVTLSGVSSLSSGDLNLVLLPGTHNLRSLSISGAESISLIGTAGETNVKCSVPPNRYNLQITGAANITIQNIKFIGCKLEIERSNNTEITQSEFTNSRYGALEFSTCFNVTIKNCTFEGNQGSPYNIVIKFVNSRGIEVTRSNFIDNTASYISSIVYFDRSSGDIELTKSNFTNNILSSRSGIVYFDGSSGYIKSNFTNNILSYHSSIVYFDGSSGYIELTKSNFTNNTVSYNSGIVYFVGSNGNIELTKSNFTNNIASYYSGIVHFVGCSGDIELTKTNFTNNTVSYRSGIVYFNGSSGDIELTKTNFTNNTASSHSGIVYFDDSSGFISCSVFHSNSVGSYGGIVKVNGRNDVNYITNSTFTKNSVSRYGGIILIDSYSTEDFVTVISCVFKFNTAQSFGGVVNVDTSTAYVTILASDISHNRAGYSGGTIHNQNSNKHLFIDCTSFFNTSANYRVERTSIQNSTFCSEIFAIGELGILCRDNICDCEACRPPDVTASIEFQEYDINEGIRLDNFALLVCAMATNVPFPISVSLNVSEGTAKEDDDYIPLQSFEAMLARGESKQSHCITIEILDDEIIESTETFTVTLSSNDPQVSFIIDEATIKIIDDDGEIITTTAATTMPASTTMPAGTTMPATTTIVPVFSAKTVLVECGVYCRLIHLNNNGGNDLDSVKQAIINVFPGLTFEYIAILKIKSEQFQGHFIDITGPNLSIEHNSVIQVVLYSRFKGICSV